MAHPVFQSMGVIPPSVASPPSAEKPSCKSNQSQLHSNMPYYEDIKSSSGSKLKAVSTNTGTDRQQHRVIDKSNIGYFSVQYCITHFLYY